jgi:hypothetical protein
MAEKDIRITVTWAFPNKTQGTTDSVPDVVPQSLDRVYGHVLSVKAQIRPNYGVLCAHLCGQYAYGISLTSSSRLCNN